MPTNGGGQITQRHTDKSTQFVCALQPQLSLIFRASLPPLHPQALGGIPSPLTLPAGSPANPTVILLAGLQGAGKTTTAGKLARLLMSADKAAPGGGGRKVLLASADTFRPAAAEQLVRRRRSWCLLSVHVSQHSPSAFSCCGDAASAVERVPIWVVRHCLGEIAATSTASYRVADHLPTHTPYPPPAQEILATQIGAAFMPQSAAGGASAGPAAIARKAVEEARRLGCDTGARVSISFSRVCFLGVRRGWWRAHFALSRSKEGLLRPHAATAHSPTPTHPALPALPVLPTHSHRRHRRPLPG